VARPETSRAGQAPPSPHPPEPGAPGSGPGPGEAGQGRYADRLAEPGQPGSRLSPPGQPLALQPSQYRPLPCHPAPWEPDTCQLRVSRPRVDAGRPPARAAPASFAGAENPCDCAAGAPVLDSKLLKKTLTQLQPKSEKAMSYFFAILFTRHPELRPMFPAALSAYRRRLFAALMRYAWASDQPAVLTPWLSELALSHRKYGVREGHFRTFCDALLTTVRAFSGSAWSAQTAQAWERALAHLTSVMTSATRSAQGEPAWWLAEVTGHERRRPGLAVLTLHTDPPLPYLPGQHISVQVPHYPRAWREFSPANAPRPDGLLRLHVRAVPGGAVSSALVRRTRPGDTLILGPARGHMTARAASSGSIVCIAGGTGLAPVKAIVEDLLTEGHGPDIRLYCGARVAADLYDLPALEHLAQACPRLAVTPVVSDDPGYGGLRGMVGDVAAAGLPPGTGDVFISGPPPMVLASAGAVAGRAPSARIHCEAPFSRLLGDPASG
jgi:NAD(P)H-flavin reductase/hemoglobin-like flavoprotein